MTDSAIDLLQCSAAELTTFLMEHRFDKDGVAATAFLLEGTASLPNADEIAAQLMGGDEEVDEDTENEEDEEEEIEVASPSKTKQPKEKEAVVALVSSHSEESAVTANSSPNSENVINSNTLGAPLHKSPVELSLTNPRGKFHLTFHENGVHASTIKNPQSFVIPKGAVRNAIVFPKPTDCQFISSDSKKATITPMVLLCFHDSDDNGNDEDDQQLTAVTFKDKPLSQICFALPLTLEETLESALKQQGNNSSSSSVEEAWMQLLSYSLDIPQSDIYRIANPNITSAKTKPRWTFQSYQEANTSSTAGNLPFVKTYFGVQDGCLFPMEEGLLFFKPPLFLPRSKMASIACGRGTGASSRYVDMHVTLDDETALEFTNISREELSVLNQYIHSVLIPAMQRDGNDDEDNSNVATNALIKTAEGAHQNSNEESDDSVEVVKVKGGRPKRAAACDAAQQTKQHYMANNDDEDDEDSDEDELFGMEDASENEATSDEDNNDEDFDEVVEVGTSKGVEGKNQRDDDSEDEGEADDDDVVEVDVAETDTEEEDDDDDDEEASPPPSKKSRSKK